MSLFSRYYGLLSEAVSQYPAAIGMELMNEPMFVERWKMFDTWRAVNAAIVAVIPDMSVGIMDLGEGAILPSWWSYFDAGQCSFVLNYFS